MVLGETWEFDGLTWTQAMAPGPAARWGHSLTHDSWRGVVVMFGGTPDGIGVSDELWEWNGAWHQRSPVTAPVGRRNHAAAFDASRGRLVVFGGYGGPLLADTWEWDGTAWHQAAATAPIPPSAGHAMWYDPLAARCVMFGGQTASSSVYLDDTWHWDGATWTLLVPAARPAARAGAAIAYDPIRHRAVLSCGGNRTSVFADCHEWDGGTWVPVATAPAVRASPAAAYDRDRQRVVLFGGLVVGPGPGAHAMGDTWEYALPGLAVVASFGAGCGNPVLEAMPGPASRPVLGTTLSIDLVGVPAGLPFFAYGVSDRLAGAIALPLDLTFAGMPGCQIWQSSELMALPCTPTGPGTARHTLSLPANPGLVGIRLYAQPWAADPASNAAGLITGNGLRFFTGTF